MRDVALAAVPRPGLTVRSNRGVAGIDGRCRRPSARRSRTRARRRCCSATSRCCTTPPGWSSDREPSPDLTVTVLDDDGGGIFHLLEQGGPAHAHAFERVFGTPTGVDVVALARAVGWAATDWGGDVCELAARPGSGRRLVRVAARRDGLRDAHAGLRRTLAAALD